MWGLLDGLSVKKGRAGGRSVGKHFTPESIDRTTFVQETVAETRRQLLVTTADRPERRHAQRKSDPQPPSLPYQHQTTIKKLQKTSLKATKQPTITTTKKTDNSNTMTANNNNNNNLTVVVGRFETTSPTTYPWVSTASPQIERRHIHPYNTSMYTLVTQYPYTASTV